MLSRSGKFFFMIAFVIVGSMIPFVSAEGDPSNGVQAYKLNCAACHGDNMQGSIGPPLKDNPFVSDSEDAVLMQVVAAGRVDKGMPAYSDQLSEEEIQDIVALLKDPDVLAAQGVSLNIIEPEVTTDDVLSEMKSGLIFVFLWTGIATLALLVWVKNRR